MHYLHQNSKVEALNLWLNFYYYLKEFDRLQLEHVPAAPADSPAPRVSAEVSSPTEEL